MLARLNNVSNRKKRVVAVEVSERRVTISDPDLLAEAIARWERSMAILFELQDKYEAQRVNKVSCIQNTTQS